MDWSLRPRRYVYLVAPSQSGRRNHFTVTDANGCHGHFSALIGWPVEWPQFTIVMTIVRVLATDTNPGSSHALIRAEGLQPAQVQGMVGPAPPKWRPTAVWFSRGTRPSTHTISGVRRLVLHDQAVHDDVGFPRVGLRHHLFHIHRPGRSDLRAGERHVLSGLTTRTARGKRSEPYVPGSMLEILPGPHT